ncbi:MAG TPA: YfiR/HmsC family protein, partial [Candidatus Sulfotelmatobacter sp.]|nr:YfiR/HmsC family protein [Candidatus Sulfotelmatobacter sp.]
MWTEQKKRRSEILCATLLGTFTLAVMPGPFALAQQSAGEYQVKAAYLYNFAKMTQWPEEALPAGANLIIGVLGGDEEFVRVLRDTLAGKSINGHGLEIRHLRSPDEVKFCHLVFFRSSERDIRATIEKLGRSNVLLVGEGKDFLEDGGMIDLVLENGRITYEVNSAALEGANVHYEDASRKPAGSEFPGILPVSHRRILVRVVPEYPEIAASMNLKGAVQLQATVRADGSVEHVTVLGGHPLLAQAA